MREASCAYTANEMNRDRGRLGLTVMLCMLLVCLLPGTALALQPGAPVRIGVLTVSWGPPPGVVGLIDGLLDMGYHENEDFVIGVRFTQGDIAVLPAVARELVRDGVDLLFCVGETEAKAAQQATTTHPIVFASVGDPVGQGLIQYGGLASYGPSYYASGRQAARLVDKIIKGAHPGEIPVEVDNYFELVINLKVAKTLGITIPPEVLYQADQIIR